jgi:predicted nucleic acid-binding Zn ribbon protein
LNDAVGAGRVWAEWAKIVGEQIAAHAEPTSLRDGVLRVRAESPSWATEIGYLAGEITRRVNGAVGREVVRELKVWTGPGETARRGEARAEEAAGEAVEENTRGAPPDDPKEALKAARQAWEKRRARRS